MVLNVVSGATQGKTILSLNWYQYAAIFKAIGGPNDETTTSHK